MEAWLSLLLTDVGRDAQRPHYSSGTHHFQLPNLIMDQQGTEPDLRIYAVVHRCEVVVLEFASLGEGGKSRLFCLDDLVQVHKVQRADKRIRTADVLITSVRSVVAEGCTGLQIPHRQRVICSLPCSPLQGITCGLGSN